MIPTILQYHQVPSSFNPEKYKDKNILVIGGGPTTNLVKWENIDYDYIFTCNQYFECNKLQNKPVEIVSLINRVLTNNSEKLQNRLKLDNSYIVIEPYHSKMVFNSKSYLTLYKNNSDKCIFFDTKFQNRSGAAPRLVILAATFKPKNIYIVGIDGYANTPNVIHSFDKNLKGPRDGNPLNLVNQDHLNFSKYIYNLCKQFNINLYNLSDVTNDSVMSNFSKKHFPLTKELKNQLI